jgi:hypothetical protein
MSTDKKMWIDLQKETTMKQYGKSIKTYIPF